MFVLCVWGRGVGGPGGAGVSGCWGVGDRVVRGQGWLW
jgi:hypothetical protein